MDIAMSQCPISMNRTLEPKASFLASLATSSRFDLIHSSFAQ